MNDRDYYRPYLRLLKSKFPTSKIIDDEQLRKAVILVHKEENVPQDPYILDAIVNQWEMMLSFIQKHFSMKGRDLTHHYGDPIDWEDYFLDLKPDAIEKQEKMEKEGNEESSKSERNRPIDKNDWEHQCQEEEQSKISRVGPPSTSSISTSSIRKEEGISAKDNEIPTVDYEIPYGAYYPMGIEIELTDETQLYLSRKSTATAAIVLLPEIRSWQSTRIRNICDFFGEQNYLSIIPNLTSTGIRFLCYF